MGWTIINGVNGVTSAGESVTGPVGDFTKGWIPNFSLDNPNAFIRLTTPWASSLDVNPDFELEMRFLPRTNGGSGKARGLVEGRNPAKTGDGAGFFISKLSGTTVSWYGTYTIRDTAVAFWMLNKWQTAWFSPSAPGVTSRRYVSFIGNCIGDEGTVFTGENQLTNVFDGYIHRVYAKDKNDSSNARLYNFAFEKKPTSLVIKNLLDETGATDVELVNFPVGNEWIYVDLTKDLI